jgi:hypothetical protein
MRSQKDDPRRQYRGGSVGKMIVGGLLLIAVVIFIASVMSGVFR